MYIVVTNSLITLEAVIMPWPGSIGMSCKSEVLVTHSVESTRSVVTHDDAEATFLLNVLYRIVAREFVPCLPKKTAIT